MGLRSLLHAALPDPIPASISLARVGCLGVFMLLVGMPVAIAAPTTPTADFTDNGDGTVTHIRTGLMWKRCAEGQTWNGSTCTGGAAKYDLGSAIALTSSSAGYNDWRLPTANELVSIVEYQTFNLAISTTIFPNTSAIPTLPI